MYIRNLATHLAHPWGAVNELAADALTHPGALGVDMAAFIADLSVGEVSLAALDAVLAAETVATEAITSDYDPDQEWATWAAYLAAQSLVGV